MMNSKIGKVLNATAMFSFDRLTEGGNVYPLLFSQAKRGMEKLIDRQHLMIFFSTEYRYTQMINKDIDITAHFGYQVNQH
jgi:hypothetical protein